jgi:hypothetical protein
VPNITRFLVLCNARTAAAHAPPSGADKTALLVLFDAPDRAGHLRDLLDAFARHRVNLSHVEKRPVTPAVLATVLASAGEPPARAPAVPLPAHAAGVFPRPPSQELLSSDAANGAAVAVPPAILVPTLSGGVGSAVSAFRYAFFLEAEDHETSPQMTAALAEARARDVRVLILGSFPRARRVL